MFPAELTQYDQWVCWRVETDGAGKPTKVPYQALSGHKASDTNPNHWTTFQQACMAYRMGGYSGVGFVLTENDPYTFLDLDDPEGNPLIIERHNKLIDQMDSYTEWSPSGKGMHIIVRGSVPQGSHREKLGVFSNKRYMTMTGNTFLDRPIADRSDILPLLYADMGTRNINVAVQDSPQKDSDYDIWERAANAQNGDNFQRLWGGEWQERYTSQSEADFALVNMLGFYSRNSQQIERMFLQSGLGRRLVTGEKTKSKKYVPEMIRRSFDNQIPDIDISQLTANLEKQFKKVVINAPKPDAWVWTKPPGLIGDIMQFIFDAAPLPVREIAIAGAFGFFAGLVGRMYNVMNEGLNIYMLVLALTGTGKEAAAKGINKLVNAIHPSVPLITNFQGPAEIASGPALTKHLAANGACCVSLLGEFGLRLHEMTKDGAPSHMVGLRRLLLDLFHKSGRGATLQQHVYSDKAKNTDVIRSPAYSILGESTPKSFYGHLDESMIEDGLLPRFIVIEYEGDRVPLNYGHHLAQPPDDLVRHLITIAAAGLEAARSDRCIDVQWMRDAEDMQLTLASEYTEKINNERDNEVARQLYNRAHLKICKIAALIAVGVDYYQPVITLDYMEWAKNLVERDIANILHKFSSGKVGRDTGELNQVREVTLVIKNYINRQYDKTLTAAKVPLELHAKGIVPYGYLNRTLATRSAFKQDRLGSTLAINKALQTLISDGAIREIRESTMQKEFGISLKAYAVVLPEYFA